MKRGDRWWQKVTRGNSRWQLVTGVIGCDRWRQGVTCSDRCWQLATGGNSCWQVVTGWQWVTLGDRWWQLVRTTTMQLPMPTVTMHYVTGSFILGTWSSEFGCTGEKAVANIFRKSVSTQCPNWVQLGNYTVFYA